MAFIMNASAEEQTVKVRGNYFHFKPGQIKQFDDSFAHFMVTERAYLGLVDLPRQFEDLEFKGTEEGKKILAEKAKQGIDARVKHLRSVIYNNEVSLRQDLEKKNIKVDPKVYASDGEIAAYEELIKYQSKDSDAAQKRVDRIKELEAKLKESE